MSVGNDGHLALIGRKRRSWTRDEKRRIVQESLEEGAEERCPDAAGQMEVVLLEGDRIIVWADVETAALTRVLRALSRR